MSKELEDLQTYIAFQERSVEELNAALIRQQEQLDAFRLQMRLLKEKIAELEDRLDSKPLDPRDERPPHY